MNDNFKKVRRVLWFIFIANIVVAIIKIGIGIIMKSTSMSADGFHSLTDGSSNIVGLIGIYFASKPVDKDHPYGHRKYEMMAGLFISGMLFFLGGKIVIQGILRFIEPVEPNITLNNILLIILTIGINICVSLYEHEKGKELDSQILISDSLHTKSDVFISSGVLITLICIKLGLPNFIDSLTSLVVSGFIFHAAYKIYKDNSGVLLDTAVIDNNDVINIVMSFESVKDIHKIRSRGSKNDIYIDMHIMTEPNLSVEQSHKLIHQVEDKMRIDINENIQVFAHLEPFHIKSPENHK